MKILRKIPRYLRESTDWIDINSKKIVLQCKQNEAKQPYEINGVKTSWNKKLELYQTAMGRMDKGVA